MLIIFKLVNAKLSSYSQLIDAVKFKSQMKFKSLRVLRKLIEFVDFINNIFFIARNCGFLLFVEKSFRKSSITLNQN